MLIVPLNKKEYDFFSELFLTTNNPHIVLIFTKQGKDKYILNVSEDQAEEIRDLCGEELQIKGFDEKYELTSVGKILESLIDKFLI